MNLRLVTKVRAIADIRSDVVNGRQIIVAAHTLKEAKAYAHSTGVRVFYQVLKENEHLIELNTGSIIHLVSYRGEALSCRGLQVDNVYIVNRSTLRMAIVESVGLCATGNVVVAKN